MDEDFYVIIWDHCDRFIWAFVTGVKRGSLRGRLEGVFWLTWDL